MCKNCRFYRNEKLNCWYSFSIQILFLMWNGRLKFTLMTVLLHVFLNRSQYDLMKCMSTSAFVEKDLSIWESCRPSLVYLSLLNFSYFSEIVTSFMLSSKIQEESSVTQSSCGVRKWHSTIPHDTYQATWQIKLTHSDFKFYI